MLVSNPTITEQVAGFIKNLRASGHNIEDEETVLKSLDVVLPSADQATLFKAIKIAGGFRIDGMAWLFPGVNISTLQNVATSLKPTAESTAEIEKETEPIDLSIFKPDS